MEQIGIWISISVGIIIPFIGWIFRNLISRDIEDLRTKQKEDHDLYFKRLDAIKLELERDYVRKDIYDQAMKFYNEHNDEKFKSLLTIMNTQFENMESRIEEIKKLITDKL